MSLIFLMLLGCWQDQDSPPVIKPEQAGQHANQTVIVEMEVKSSNFLKDRDMCFLNSLADHRGEDNFTAVLRKAGLEAFKKEDIDDPAKHFLKKKIRVQGKIELYNKKPQIVVEKFDQIKVVGIRPGQ